MGNSVGLLEEADPRVARERLEVRGEARAQLPLPESPLAGLGFGRKCASGADVGLGASSLRVPKHRHPRQHRRRCHQCSSESGHPTPTSEQHREPSLRTGPPPTVGQLPVLIPQKLRRFGELRLPGSAPKMSDVSRNRSNTKPGRVQRTERCRPKWVDSARSLSEITLSLAELSHLAAPRSTDELHARHVKDATTRAQRAPRGCSPCSLRRACGGGAKTRRAAAGDWPRSPDNAPKLGRTRPTFDRPIPEPSVAAPTWQGHSEILPKPPRNGRIATHV